MAEPSVSIVIPVKNAAATIGDCLRSVLSSRVAGRSQDVIVVLNQSSDASGRIAARFPVTVLDEPRRGACNARNRGILESGGDVVVFVDADCLASAAWLDELTRPFADPNVAAAAGEVVPFPGSSHAERYIAWRKPLWQEWTRRHPTPWFLAGNVAFRREVFSRIGIFDPRFDEAGGEDIDLSWRFFEAGLHLEYCPKALVFHRNRQTLQGLFTQHMRNGRAQAILWRKYRPALRWGARDECRAWIDLGRSIVPAAVAAARGLNHRAAGRSVSDADFVRKLAQRIGFVRGALAWHTRPRFQ
jgi:cellulose synthase/poly-beta-1,6-N-acetylglucosamine synthase-like glycosyltransferase